MADDEEYDVEYYTEETSYEHYVDGDSAEGKGEDDETSPSGLPVRKKSKRVKVDTSKFMTPYLEHSHKMQQLFSQNKYKEQYEKHRGEPYAISTDTPELRRIRKAQAQLSEIKYRMEGDIAKTNCHVDVLARDIEHAKKVSQQVSKVLYKQKWEDTKEKYMLPPDAPELVQALKNSSMFSKKLYTADWEEDKSLYFPYSDSPELRRVASAQKALSDISYKKGHHERKAHFTSLPDPPDVELAKRAANQLSDIKYREDYRKKVKGHWSQTPCYEVAIARMNSDNISNRKYQEDYENTKDQIYFMQTETPEYSVKKRAGANASTIKYKADYEKSKGPTGYHVLPATENPLLMRQKSAGQAQSDVLYRKSYEQSRGSSINYCDTPKFQIDNVLKKFSDIQYKETYQKKILGHYIGSYEDPHMLHCMKVASMRSDKNYKADYEEDKASCYFPQTITQEYEATKKLEKVKDHTYRQHPGTMKFTQVTDSPVQVQAALNAKQLSDLNYKADYEAKKFKCSIPADSPFILQSRVNAYNLSDNMYKYDWERSKAKKFEIKVDAIPLIAAKANRRKASDVAYKMDYEKNKGKMVGALSIQDDPKMLHSMKVGHMQSNIEYKKDYEKTKTKYSSPLDMIPVTLAKKAQSIASNIDYKHLLHNYFYPPDSVNVALAKKSYTIQSDVDYKSDYNSWVKGCGWVPFGSLDVEKVKRATAILDEKKYRQHPDTLKFTAIDDAPIVVQSKINQAQRSDIVYKAAAEKRLHTYTQPHDLPEFIQARVNAINLSDNCYKAGLAELKTKGYDLKIDAIPIKAAKAARRAASDVQYHLDYEKQKGKLVGFRSLQDDPKLVHNMHIAKMQSDREYKKDYEKTKTKYNTPLDMVNVVSAKKAQDIASNIHYKHLLHRYTYLPDAMSVALSRNMMQIQSNNLYKADYNSWMKGIGWIPIGSLDVEKAKKAGIALDEKKYRQHPDTIKFTSVVDSPVMVQAKTNAEQLSDRLYKASGEKYLHKYNLPADMPQFIQARYNAANISESNYKQAWKELIAKGNSVLGDAIPIVAAKASRNIASDYKYKQAYEKTRGKHVGFRSLQDDPKLVHFMKVAKMQSEREYKKDYEKTKTKYHTPLDMVSITAAKKSQEVATNINYKRLIHHYTCLPDNMSVELSRNRMQIQSDNAYKMDYNSWFKGIGWSPLGSLDVEKVKKAGQAISEKQYRQHPDTLKFTSLSDSMGIALAQSNTKQLSDISYKASGEKLKHKYTLNPDVPQFIQSRINAINMSDKHYKAAWIKHLAKGYDLKQDAIPIVAAKASRNIASDYKYRESYEKDKGKQVGFRSLQDDPKLVHYMNVAKMQSDREYKKNYEKSKTKYHTPVDMLSVANAKKAQEVSTNTNYKQLIHSYTLLPDAMHLELSRNRMQIQSDNLYKADFNNWLKGVGWVPIGSLDVEKAKKAKEILSEHNYRQHPDKLKFTTPYDAMDQVLARSNAQTMNKRLYTETWNKDKTKIHVMPDTPEILLSKVNQLNMSDKLYRQTWEEDKKKGYDLRPDAIAIKAARASRDIASDYKYKLAYEKTRGKHIGFRSLQDDPKLVHFMEVAKMQSEREYRKNYEKSKTKFHTPVDMFSVTAAKLAQEVATNTNYKQLIHNYNLMPDSMNFELARNRMQIQSDNVYKADYNEFMKGVGWIPFGSQEAEKNKKAMEIVSEKKYRQHPDTLKFTSLTDAMPMVLAQNNAKTMNQHLYKEAWEKDKTKIHLMPDLPEILLAKSNAINISENKYRRAMEEDKKKGYDLRVDAIAIKAAKASRDIASDYKYKHSYEMDKGKLVGFRSLQDDPKMVHFMNVAKMQSDREYKKDYEKTKTKYHTPVTMFSVIAAKAAQAAISNTNYKHLIHNYFLMPDAMNLQLAKNMSQIQSNNEYKVDYNSWYKGIGWSPLGSLDVEKSKKASEILSEAKYRQHPSNFRFTSLMDSMPMELAKQNAQTMNRNSYISAWEKDKTAIHVMPDTPEILLAKQNKITYSQSQYKLGWQEAIKKGYDLRPDAISITAARASRDIASDYKYKTAYRQQQGHHVGFRSLQDDPKSVWAMHVAKIQSDREYKKDFEKTRTKFNMPVDMLDILLAKKCQSLVSDIDYRRILHNWTCLPDQTGFVQARKVYEIQSDNVYKADYNEYMKGVGWIPFGSQEAEKNKKAMEIISEKKYRQHPDTLKFTSVTDSMDIVLAKNNAMQQSHKLYKEAWEKDKTRIHIMPDTPEILLAKVNLINTSDKLYKQGYQELKKKGYDLRADAIAITAAKASRDIASDYKYKAAYRQQKGHHVGFRSLQDDPKSVWAMHVAKIQSDREYKKDFEKTRTKFNMPVDMLDILLAKKGQILVSDIDYRRRLHNWTCLPDQTNVVHARKTYDIQSDIAYKSDLQWLRGIGWSPSGSLDDEKNKRAEIIKSDNKYRQHPDTIKFTSVTDSLEMALAKSNAEIMNKRLYTDAWNKDKGTIHIMPDTPEIEQAKLNKINFSEKEYRRALEKDKAKGYDLRADAIAITAARASRDIASDYKYKAAYRKQLGHHVGFRSLQDDPKSVWAMHVAKIQSDREYKKDFDKWRTKFNSPVDMLGILLAKKCQTLVSDIDYRRPLHQWTCLPDQNDVIHARKAYDLQSDNLYKADLQWMKGIGWVPIGSLDVEKCKKAGEILSERKYRQPPDRVKFTSVTDSMEVVLAKANAEIMNKRLYTEAWDKDKRTIHIMPDTPEITLARQNKINYSESMYKQALEESKKKGYDLRIDAIPIQAAKASRDIASDYKYKTGYRKQVGHHVGYRSLQDDPRSVLAMNVGKMQSEREYKKDFEKTKTNFNMPVDMLDILLAKKCQTLVSDIDYRRRLHQWTCLPDQNDVIHARKAYDLQSDNLYKADLQWLKGVGWVPIGSLDVEKNKRAGDILSEKKYRQPPDTLKFTSVTDSLALTLAKANAETMNKRLYTDAWNKDKTTIHVMPDTPEILLAKQNRVNYSEKQYKIALEESKKKGYDLRLDAIAIKSAKASRDIASDYKYKTAYRQQQGHYVGFRSLQDDPKSVWAMHVAKIQSDREYKKDFEKSKVKYNSPVDMLGVLLAKNCQKLVSDIDYRHYLHQWTCLPDQNDVIQAKKAYNLQSDAVYKSDMEWMKGVGWVPIGSIDVEKVKRAGEILSDQKYRQRPDSLKFTSILDTPELVLAKNNALQNNNFLYREAWDKDKGTIHVMPDTPEILLAKANSVNISKKLYTQGWDKAKQKGYDLRSDAIAIKSARASRDIASDYKYKAAYEKQRGHHVGFRSLEDDPKSVWAMHVAKIQSEREYKKDFEKSKVKYNSPVDMLGVLLAKNCQKLVSDIDYRHYLHQWTCLPDQNDVIQARKAYDLQSDALYKSDMEWIKGCGWVPIGSVDVIKVKKAQEILNERLYRQPPETIKFTSIVDPPAIVLAKTNADQISDWKYKEAWEKDKRTIHVMPDTPEIVLSRANAINISKKLYQQSWEESKKKGYDLRADAIPITVAKASRDIASDYKYKAAYRKQQGHYVGFRSLQDDPKSVWAMHVAKIQSDREYKKDFEVSKTKYNSPVDMLGILLAKNCQKLVSDIDYRHYLHQWTCLPDQNDVIQAKKAYELQSDWLYKSDMEWIKGCGWIPSGSLEVNKVKKAQEILNDHLYRQRPDTMKFTSIVDPPAIVLAKTNADQISEWKYKEAWENDKRTIHVMPDTPEIVLSRANAINVSKKLYEQAWQDSKKKGYDLRVDAISIKSARASRDIASEYKYKSAHEKQKGHYIGTRSAQDDHKLMGLIKSGKLHSDLIYKKDYEKTKTNCHIPGDMVSIKTAKDSQAVASYIDYRHYLHQWTCHPDQNDCIQAKKAYDLQSDAIYKSDMEWIKGCGWVPIGSVDVLKVKKAQEILNDRLYRQRPDAMKFTSIVDPPAIVLSKINADQISEWKYKEAWEKDKTIIHVMPDTPEIVLSRTNAINVSKKRYRDDWDKVKSNYDLRRDAIPIVAAKSSRDIASDYKYKKTHEKEKGHYIGCKTAHDDNKLANLLRTAKINNELEYRKAFEKSKTKINLPVDMVSVLSAKQCQALVSNIDYRQYLHQWTCHPDQNDCIQAKKAYELQSDALYKSDLEWLRGIGWMPNESHDVKRVKNAQEILSERIYRTKPETMKFTPVTDRVDYVTAKQSGELLSDIKYHEAWNAVKTNYTALLDSPLLNTARQAAKNINHKLYTENWDKQKATSYKLPVDAVQLTHAKRSNVAQSELKYKSEYIKQRGHYVGVPSMKDDPKLVWFKHAGLIQNDREYQKVYQKSKSKITIPEDMVSLVTAKQGQTLASGIDYRHYLHQWTCHPDQNDCIQAKKAYELQSDNIYKQDMEWIRGCGWIPLDSVEHQKVRKAQELVNMRVYKKDAQDNFAKFTHVVDTPEIVLANMNNINQSDLRYKETFISEKGHYIGSKETPQITHSKEMSKLASEKLYKSSWDSSKALGYILPPDYLPLVGAKHANRVSSELKYKELHEKLKGHYLAGKHISDFPSVVRSLDFQKMRSMLLYKKNYEDNKTKITIPNDMLNNVLAKKCQQILSEIEYRHYLHEWTCLPDKNDIIHARKAGEILSDVVYKDDLTWLKGIGCYVWDTPEIIHAKQSYDLQSQNKYIVSGKENLKNFSVVTDTPVYVTAVQSGIQASDVKYKEIYNKNKDKYTPVLETVDYNRTQGLKDLFSSNIYRRAWDKVKANSYSLPSDSFSLALMKQQKHLPSTLKYREEYEKFKALYTIPKGIQDDPNTERCLRVGKLPLDRLYKDVYEKNKAKIHIAPDMLEIVTAKETQNKVSEVDYRKYLHEWTCMPDMQINIHARKVNEQLSDIMYKDDLRWLKGIGCFVWDTPEILHANHAYDLRNDFKYKAKAKEMKANFTVVTDTPVYVQAVTSGKQQSDVVYHSDYEHNVKGKVTSTTGTVDLERASHANKIQSDNLYRDASIKSLPKGYKLPLDTPSILQAKKAQALGSDYKYKEVYEHIKAKAYTLGPDNVNMTNIRKVNAVLNERLYRQLYHKQKDKIHTTPDTPEIRQVKATQEAISDLVYKSDYERLKGHLISMPYTPQLLHCRYVGEITSDNKYKEDLQWLKGLGCFLYDTPDMVRARDLRKLWSNYLYTNTAKKMFDKFSVVMDTPEYRRVQELKTHLSQVVYRAEGNKSKEKFTSILDTPEFLRAKKGQEIQSQYLYVEVATKERPHHHADGQTQGHKHARNVKDLISEKKYKAQYEKFKHKYTTVADSPVLIQAKKAYFNASDLRYKETFEHAKGKYHTVKDALDIVYHRKVTDDISSVKYKEKYVNQLGIWRSIPDRPEHFHHRMVTDSISDFKYKEDLTWLKGIGCYVWDTPDLVLAEQNKSLYSMCKYKEKFEKIKSTFHYTADTPLFNHFKYASELMNERLYKSDYEKEKTKYSVVVDDPRHLLAKSASEQISQWKYKYNYEKEKANYTTVIDTPEHTRTQRAGKQISDIIYKMEYQKAKAKGYTSIHDTPLLLHMRKVKDKISELKYKELYEKSKGNCNLIADAVEIQTAKQAYKAISNLDYKKKYEANKAHWQWTVDRPDFMQNAKASMQQSDYDYKLDREWLKGCKLSVTDDKDMVLALKNAEMNSNVKYKTRYEKGTYQGDFKVVPDTPQILHAKSVSHLMSETKYKEDSKKQLPIGSFTTLAETRDTVHVKEVTKNFSGKIYKERFEKEKGKSNYAIMQEPPEVKHAMEVAKNQSNIAYRKDAKSKLHYTSTADRPDIKKATQVAKLVSDIQYKAKAREEAGRGVSIVGRPDIQLAQDVSKLTSQTEYAKGELRGHGAASYDTPLMRQLKKTNALISNVKYKENFVKEKGKKPQFNPKESKIYQTQKEANTLASEVKYKADLKKLHKPVTDMSESLQMYHITSTSKLSSDYQYKKEFQKSKGHYHVIPDNLEQLHHKEASELQSLVKYKEKYEKEKGKAMLDFETPTYVTAKEAQHMQSEKEYKKDFEESMKGKNLSGLEVTPALVHARHATKIASEKEYRKDLNESRGKGLSGMEETPDMLRAKNATHILNEKEYKKTLELEIKGKGLSTLATETPDFVRAKNATDIFSQVKYKHSAEIDKANFTSVVDTPEIIHAQQVRNLSSQKKYKEEAERTMSFYVPVFDTPEMQRVRENQKNFSTLQYQSELKILKGKVTVVQDTPEILRVKENQKNFSSIKYKDSLGQGTSIPDLPEVKRVKETQKHISSVMYKELLGQGTPTTVTPEIERVKRNQENISSVLYKEHLGVGTPTPVTPEMERVKRNQEHISSVLYKEILGQGTPTPVTPEMERVKHNQENISSVLYKENLGHGTPAPVTPEIERVKRNQENISSVLYKESLGKATSTPVTPEMERVKRNQENISSVLYKESLGKATSTPVTPEMERVKRNQENISSVLYKEDLGKATPATVTPEMERVKRNQENISSVLYSDSFRKQVQGKAAFVLDTPEMRRVRESQRHISSVRYHEDFEKHKGSFTPVVTDPITERVKKNMIDFSDLNYRGIQRRVVEMERKRVDPEQETMTDLRVWRTNPGSVFDYDPAEDNIQSRSLHMLSVQAQRRSREHSRSASALSLSAGDEKSETSEAAEHHLSTYSNGPIFTTAGTGYKQAKATELPQQRSSSVATQQTTVSSVPSHPSTTGKTFRAMYDYRAVDDDEVSFKDGDAIVNVQTIDEGWMYGTVHRTGKTGMLPANYVEAV
ncbi:nebulin isoform X8 [Pleurodeles waltl]|uniref:nebulin isoform X8 n=1 Tax=Pleurodeles waltl TaxID=8319 RepID=UPI0037099709